MVKKAKMQLSWVFIGGFCACVIRITYAQKPPVNTHVISWADQEGGQGIWTPPLENHTTTGFLSNTGPDPLKNRKATKPAFNVG